MKNFIVLRVSSSVLLALGVVFILFSLFGLFTGINDRSSTGDIMAVLGMLGGGVLFVAVAELIKLVLKIYDKVDIE